MLSLTTFFGSGTCQSRRNSRMLIYLAMVFGSLSSTPSLAVLVEVSDSGSPFGASTFNITRDTATNLDWLDWDASVNISFNDMLTMFDAGDLYVGWRHATRDEVKTLFDHMSLPTGSWPNFSNVNDLSLADDAFDLIGVTSLSVSENQAIGITADPASFAGYQHRATIKRTSTISETYGHYVQPVEFAHIGVGHVLVRVASVPEPSAFLGIGLIGLGLAGWKIFTAYRVSS